MRETRGWSARQRGSGMVRRLAVVATALTLMTLGACGDNGGSSGDGEGGTMRFVFSPDPVWNWLEDEGILGQMEEDSGYTIERNESEDEFAFFAGGHADIVSTGSYETPVLEAETDVETVTIGKYNMAKDIVVVPSDEPAASSASSRSAAPRSCGRRSPRTSTAARSARGPRTSRWRSPTSTRLPSSW